MVEKKALLYQLQLVFYFVKEHGYGLLEVVDQNSKSNGDFWLVNNKNKNYSTIKVTTNKNTNQNFDIKFINNYIGKIINNYQKELVFCINNDETNDQDIINIYNGFYSGKDVSDVFKGIKTIFEENDNIDENISKYTSLLKYELDLLKKKEIKKANFNIITYSVIALCLFVYFLIHIFSNIYNGSIETSIIFGAYYKILIMSKEYFRLLSYGFVHIDFFHLLLNLISLYNLGVILEPIFGRVKFLITLILSIIAGGFFTYILSNNVLMVGISGGLYGLFGLLLVYYFYSGAYKKFNMKFISVIFVNVIINFIPNIAVYSHIGGFIIGLLLGIYYINNKNYKNLKFNSLISLVIVFIVLIFNFINVKPIKLDDVYIKTDENIVNFYDKIGFKNYSYKLKDNLYKIYIEYAGGK
ncbi:MAG: rhomboid family intramembrane serine protease [Erysipelotrichaceae bacterium]|nr:rhomboid family intramembrane serine protease [Erysipelotrichaceae bacterium]